MTKCGGLFTMNDQIKLLNKKINALGIVFFGTPIIAFFLLIIQFIDPRSFLIFLGILLEIVLFIMCFWEIESPENELTP